METSQTTPHLRDTSLKVCFPPEQVEKTTREIKDGKVAEEIFALFTLWVCEDAANYDQAKVYIRELSVDQVRAGLAVSLRRDLVRKLN